MSSRTTSLMCTTKVLSYSGKLICVFTTRWYFEHVELGHVELGHVQLGHVQVTLLFPQGLCTTPSSDQGPADFSAAGDGETGAGWGGDRTHSDQEHVSDASAAGDKHQGRVPT